MSTYKLPEEQDKSANKPFLYSEELSLFDKWSIGIYLLLTIFVTLSYDRIAVDYAHMMIIAYAIMLQLGGYFFLYRSLRNFRCYLIWFGFSIIHTAMYFVMKDDRRLLSLDYSPVTMLRNTFVLLLFFQVLRYISLKTQNMEFVAPSKGSDTDFLDHRKITAIDKMLFLAYAALFGVLAYFSFPH